MSKLKGNKSFMGLTNSECIDASKHLMDNAKGLYNDAKLLANNGSYGHATSMLIHSTEETMKALILFLDGNGFLFRRKVKGINNLFVNHKLRYGLAMLLSVLNIFSEDLKDLFQKIKNEPNLILALNKDKEQMGRILLQYAQKKIKIVIQEIFWFSKAEFIRQEGFYVDYVDEIKTPLQISKKDFEDVLIRIEGMRSSVSGLIQVFDSNDKMLVQDIDKYKQQFINENWYENIGKVIEMFKDGKTNPLEALSNTLTEFSEELDNKTTLND
jgi:AbiV family abortive infection protein